MFNLVSAASLIQQLRKHAATHDQRFAFLAHRHTRKKKKNQNPSHSSTKMQFSFPCSLSFFLLNLHHFHSTNTQACNNRNHAPPLSQGRQQQKKKMEETVVPVLSFLTNPSLSFLPCLLFFFFSLYSCCPSQHPSLFLPRCGVGLCDHSHFSGMTCRRGGKGQTKCSSITLGDAHVEIL